VCGGIPVTSAIQEVEVGGSWSKVDQGKNLSLYLKNKVKKAEELGVWFKW
jgi:hypothetical protein